MIQLGNHVLICDDAKHVNLDAVITQPIDLILTDPPYGIDYVESKRGFADIHVEKDIENDQPVTDYSYMIFTQNWLEHVLPCMARRE
jgi:DNA modification methylase